MRLPYDFQNLHITVLLEKLQNIPNSFVEHSRERVINNMRISCKMKTAVGETLYKTRNKIFK